MMITKATQHKNGQNRTWYRKEGGQFWKFHLPDIFVRVDGGFLVVVVLNVGLGFGCLDCPRLDDDYGLCCVFRWLFGWLGGSAVKTPCCLLLRRITVNFHGSASFKDGWLFTWFCTRVFKMCSFLCVSSVFVVCVWHALMEWAVLLYKGIKTITVMECCSSSSSSISSQLVSVQFWSNLLAVCCRLLVDVYHNTNTSTHLAHMYSTHLEMRTCLRLKKQQYKKAAAENRRRAICECAPQETHVLS